MTDQLEADTQQDAHEALIQEGKALGIKQAANMKPENLIKRIEEIKLKREDKPNDEPMKKAPKVEVAVVDFGAKFLKSIGFDFEWLGPIAHRYRIDKFEYLHKFRAFRVYRDGKHVDWITVNEVGMLNGKRDMCQILLKHAPVNKERSIFDFHWRG